VIYSVWKLPARPGSAYLRWLADEEPHPRESIDVFRTEVNEVQEKDVIHAKRDYSVDRRLVMVSGVALLIGVASTFAAAALLALIHFFTNLFFYQRLSWADVSLARHTLGMGVILVPAIGGLLVGFMAR